MTTTRSKPRWTAAWTNSAGSTSIVANAGIGNGGNKLHKLPESIWQDMIDVNLSGVWKTVKAGVPHISLPAAGVARSC